MTEQNDKPWWYPEICNDDYFKRLREEYDEPDERPDEDLHDYYNNGRKYSVTWDHIGDAYEEYEPLADAFLKLESQLSTTTQELAGVKEQLARAKKVVAASEKLTSHRLWKEARFPTLMAVRVADFVEALNAYKGKDDE